MNITRICVSNPSILKRNLILYWVRDCLLALSYMSNGKTVYTCISLIIIIWPVRYLLCNFGIGQMWWWAINNWTCWSAHNLYQMILLNVMSSFVHMVVSCLIWLFLCISLVLPAVISENVLLCTKNALTLAVLDFADPLKSDHLDSLYVKRWAVENIYWNLGFAWVPQLYCGLEITNVQVRQMFMSGNGTRMIQVHEI